MSKSIKEIKEQIMSAIVSAHADGAIIDEMGVDWAEDEGTMILDNSMNRAPRVCALTAVSLGHQVAGFDSIYNVAPVALGIEKQEARFIEWGFMGYTEITEKQRDNKFYRAGQAIRAKCEKENIYGEPLTV